MSHTSRSDDASQEQVRLDQAIRDADDLLLNSLQEDERRRRRRHARWVRYSTGGFIMIGLMSVAVVVGLSAVSAVDQAKASRFAQEGNRLWQAGDLAAAEKQFGAAVEANPADANSWNGLGWTRFNTGKSAEAAEAFHKCLALEPRHPAALNGLGQVALSRGDLEEAEKHLLKAAEHGASAAWFGLTRIYLLREDFEKAQPWAQKLVDSGQAGPLGQQMLDAVRARQVDARLRQQIAPPATSRESDEGWALANRGRPREAAEKFRAALAKDPKDVAALNGLGFALLNIGQPREARPHFETALKYAPGHPGVLNGLGRSYMEAGDTDKAIEVWLSIKLEGPEGAVFAHTIGLATAYMKKQDYAKAVEYLERIVAAQPANAQYRQMLAQAKAKLQ
jgi:Flp pilus assembly protein TadD